MASQNVTWPGVTAVESLSVTLSHGISPAAAMLVTYPQPGRPANFGNLVFTDGERQVALRGCKIDKISGRVGSDGTTWVLEILDRRWRWKGLGRISGRYNQLDGRGKLVPWTIRSPAELAVLCLQAMGERTYSINLPPGLPRAAGANLDRYLKRGENFPQTLANPPVVWDNTPPAEALARLCDQYGRRVIYQPTLDRVLIAPLGVGNKLPNGPCEMIVPTLDSPETPSAVGVAGAPIRYQFRMPLEPVAREWDDSLVPIDDVSYAPLAGNGKVKIVECFSAAKAGSDGDPGQFAIYDLTIDGQWFGASGAATEDGAFGELVTAINASAVGQYVVASVPVFYMLEIRGKEGQEGRNFTVTFSLTANESLHARTEVAQEAVKKDAVDWSYASPPTFGTPANKGGIRPTKELSFIQALGRARASVWKYYRIVTIDPITKKDGLVVPGYGLLKRRQQLILQPTKVEQVEPAPRRLVGQAADAAAGDPVAPAIAQKLGVLPDFYNGYSRDKKASVTGSVARTIGSVVWAPPVNANTPEKETVNVTFEVDPVEQTVAFSDYVYFHGGLGVAGFYKRPALTLETAALVTDAATGELVRYERILPLGGNAPIEWEVHEDIQVGFVAEYDDKNKVKNIRKVDVPDADARAQFYLAGMASKYLLKGGETRQYIGIYPIELDGAIQQVSWSIGGSGPTTTASSNTEHSRVTLNYPARRRAENLPPDKAAAAANLLERQAVDRHIPAGAKP